MGYTPVAGVMMSTRTGDLDPMLPAYLMRTYGLDAEAFSDLIFLKSGLLGVSGFSSDLRDLQAGFEACNDPRAALAFEMYAYQIKKMVGAYITELGGIDTLIFTDDIGVQNARVRQLVCQGMEWCGIILDEQVNNGALHNQGTLISAPESRVKVIAMPTDEELVLVREGLRLLQGAGYVHP
jgi:acetate kinase